MLLSHQNGSQVDDNAVTSLVIEPIYGSNLYNTIFIYHKELNVDQVIRFFSGLSKICSSHNWGNGTKMSMLLTLNNIMHQHIQDSNGYFNEFIEEFRLLASEVKNPHFGILDSTLSDNNESDNLHTSPATDQEVWEFLDSLLTSSLVYVANITDEFKSLLTYGYSLHIKNTSTDLVRMGGWTNKNSVSLFHSILELDDLSTVLTAINNGYTWDSFILELSQIEGTVLNTKITRLVSMTPYATDEQTFNNISNPLLNAYFVDAYGQSGSHSLELGNKLDQLIPQVDELLELKSKAVLIDKDQAIDSSKTYFNYQRYAGHVTNFEDDSLIPSVSGVKHHIHTLINPKLEQVSTQLVANDIKIKDLHNRVNNIISDGSTQMEVLLSEISDFRDRIADLESKEANLNAKLVAAEGLIQNLEEQIQHPELHTFREFIIVGVCRWRGGFNFYFFDPYARNSGKRKLLCQVHTKCTNAWSYTDQNYWGGIYKNQLYQHFPNDSMIDLYGGGSDNYITSNFWFDGVLEISPLNYTDHSDLPAGKFAPTYYMRYTRTHKCNEIFHTAADGHGTHLEYCITYR